MDTIMQSIQTIIVRISFIFSGVFCLFLFRVLFSFVRFGFEPCVKISVM